jgi:hypothetical protein
MANRTLRVKLDEEDGQALKAYAKAVCTLLRVKLSDSEVVRRMIRQAAAGTRSSETQPILPLKRRASDRSVGPTQ